MAQLREELHRTLRQEMMTEMASKMEAADAKLQALADAHAAELAKLREEHADAMQRLREEASGSLQAKLLAEKERAEKERVSA